MTQSISQPLAESHDPADGAASSPESLALRARQFDEARAQGRLLLRIDPKTIRPTRYRNRDQRSLLLHDPAFVQLTKAIQVHGQDVPIRVRPVEDAGPIQYEIISGHRRHAACLALDAASNKGFPVLALVDAAVRDTRELVLKMYRENADREDLSPYETGMMFRHWLESGVFESQEAIRIATGQSKQNVSKYVALAHLPDHIISAFRDPRSISLRWGPDLTRAVATLGPRLEERALELARRQPPPSAAVVYASLVAPADKAERTPRVSELVKENGRLLFELSARDERLAIRLGKQVDASLRSELKRDLREWLHAWLKRHAGGA